MTLERGLRTPIGPVETWATEPELVMEINASQLPLIDITALSRIHLIGLARQLVVERQLVRFSSEGYILEVYNYNEHGHLVLVDTMYIHQGKVSEYYEQVGSIKTKWHIIWPYIERDDPPKWHRVK